MSWSELKGCERNIDDKLKEMKRLLRDIEAPNSQVLVNQLKDEIEMMERACRAFGCFDFRGEIIIKDYYY